MTFDRYYEQLMEGIRYVNLCAGRTQVYVLLMNTFTKRLFDAGMLPDITWERRRFEESLTATIQDVAAVVGNRASNGQIVHTVRSLGSLAAVQFRLNDCTSVIVRPFFDWGNAFNDGKVFPSRFGYCGLAFKSLGILSDGRVILCCADYDGDTALGTLADQSLPDMLLSDRAQSVSRAMNHFRLIDPKCQRCIGSTNPIKTALKVLLISGMFKLVKPGPGKSVREINPALSPSYG